MCGLAGFFGPGPETEEQALAWLRRMGDAIAHRGPDSDGYWFDRSAGLGLSHRRLAIVDLSEQGAQPMVSSCGRYVMAFNGEIYNHLELREQFAPQAWRGHSDTETILAGFTQFGVHATLPRLDGMFAIAVWDRQTQVLSLARDRMGEKPLYYGTLPSGAFVFGSELKALRAHPHWSAAVNRDALALFLRHNDVPAPHTIYTGISKLEPASWLDISRSHELTGGRFWDVRKVAQRITGMPDLDFGVSEADSFAFLSRCALGFEPLSNVFPDRGKLGSIPLFATATLLTAYRSQGRQWHEYLTMIERAFDLVAPLPEEAVPALLLQGRRYRALKDTDPGRLGIQ